MIISRNAKLIYSTQNPGRIPLKLVSNRCSFLNILQEVVIFSWHHRKLYGPIRPDYVFPSLPVPILPSRILSRNKTSLLTLFERECVEVDVPSFGVVAIGNLPCLDLCNQWYNTCVPQVLVCNNSHAHTLLLSPLTFLYAVPHHTGERHTPIGNRDIVQLHGYPSLLGVWGTRSSTQ